MNTSEQSPRTIKIHYRSLLYRLWEVTYSYCWYARASEAGWNLKTSKVPEPTNLFEFLLRILILSVPMGVVTILCLTVYYGFRAFSDLLILLAWITESIVLVGLGIAKPTVTPLHHRWKTDDDVLTEFRRFPPVQIKGRQLPRWSVVVCIWLAALYVGALISSSVVQAMTAEAFLLLLQAVMPIAVIGSIVWVLLGMLIILGEDLDGAKMRSSFRSMREGLRAWKRKVCPKVEVVRSHK